MQRLDYTRTGTWRLLPAAMAAAPWHAGAPAWPQGAADAILDDRDFEVQELGPENWNDIAPLFQRSAAAPD